MSPLGRQCSSLSFLLTLLWTVGPSGAGQPQSPVNTALDPQQVLRVIVQEVKTELETLINQIVSRIDGLDSHLASVDSRLTTVDSRLSGIESRLNVLDLKQDAFDASLDDHSSRIESAEARVGPGLGPLTSRLNFTDARIDELASQINSTAGRLNSGLDPLTSQLNFTGARLDHLASQINSTAERLNSGLDPLTSELNSTKVRLDQLTSHVNTTEDRLGSTVEELVSQVNGTTAGQSDRLDRMSSHLNELSTRLDDLANLTDAFLPRPRDCSELPAGARSGIYQLRPHPFQPPVPAYCDLETDGGRWTVIQRRKDIEPREDFNRNWTDYREGFGDLQGEFWWGLQSMWKLTGSEERQYELRVNLADFAGRKRYATYSKFTVGPEVYGYQLHVHGYSGTAGDSLGYHRGEKFSTKDRDQDGRPSGSCAQKHKGGWWFFSCHTAFLNGPYLFGERTKEEGITWNRWRGNQYSLREAEMKIRPV